MRNALIMLGIFCSINIAAISAETTLPEHFDYQLPDQIEMPGGEIYHHPKIVSVRPNGITIMHDNGVAFWPFSQLPDDICKKFHYNPIAAQKYTDELLLRRRQLDEMKMKNEIADANKKVYIELVSTRYQCTELQMKIDAIKRQILWDKQKEQHIAKDDAQDRQVIAEGESSASQDTVDFWGNRSTNDDATRMHVLGEFEQDWNQGKIDYGMWNFAEHAQDENLAEYEQDYKEAQAKLKELEKQWATIQANQKQNSAKLDQEIHDKVKENIDTDLKKLQELRTMRDKQLITQQEYINKKAEILKNF